MKAILPLCAWLGSLANGVPFCEPSSSLAWDLNEVTVLFPFPRTGESDRSLLALDDKVDGNPRFDETKFFQLDGNGIAPGRHPRSFDSNEWYKKVREDYHRIRAVGFRIDPCFRDRFAEDCRRQIRVSWQILVDQSGVLTTPDAAFHTFTDLTEAEWTHLLKGLETLNRPYKNLLEGQPLQVHPVIWMQGLAGPYAREFLALVSPFIVEDRMTRTAHFLMAEGGVAWDFFTHDRQADGSFAFAKLVNVKDSHIPSYPNHEKIMFLNTGAPREFLSAFPGTTEFFVPTMTEGSENLIDLVADSEKMKSADRLVLKDLYRVALKAENPRAHLPGTMDCLSCHSADPAKRWFERNLDAQVIADVRAEAGVEYRNPRYDLRNLTATEFTKRFRGLGYLDGAPSISSRVIHESAEVADRLNGMTAL